MRCIFYFLTFFTLLYSITGFSYQLGTNSSHFGTSYYTYNPMTPGYYENCGYTGGATNGYCFDSPSYGNIFPYVIDLTLPDKLWETAGASCEIRASLTFSGVGFAKRILNSNGWETHWKEGDHVNPRMLLFLTRNSNNCLADLQNIARWGSLQGVIPAGWGNQDGGGGCFNYLSVQGEAGDFELIGKSCGESSTGGIPLPKPPPACDIYSDGEDFLDFGVVSSKDSSTDTISFTNSCDREAVVYVKILSSSSVSFNASGGAKVTLAPGVEADICLRSGSISCSGGKLPLIMDESSQWDIVGTLSVDGGSAGEYVGNLILDITFL